VTYSVIQPPFTLKFQEMSKKELEAYRTWFHKMIPERIGILAAEIQATSGFESWHPDMSPESLDALGRWLEGQVETYQTGPADSGGAAEGLSTAAGLPEEELTNRTFSLAMDVGMYFSQVVINNLPGVQWEQPLKTKKFADYGQPVLIGIGPVPLNPIRIMVNTAYGISRKAHHGSRIRELYEIWSKMKKS
jgi:hypothetical protein